MTINEKIIRLKDIDSNTKFTSIKLRLPKDVYESSSLPMYGIKI